MCDSYDPSGAGSLRVQDVPQQLRPREMFDRVGAEHVPVEVLLAILLRSGTQGRSVVDVSRDLLHRYGGLREMMRAPVEELTQLKGLGPVKAQVLKAALELARRASLEEASERPVLDAPDRVATLMRPLCRPLTEEVFWLLLLDTRNRLMQPPMEVTRGILDASLVHPREVFRPAIQAGAKSILVAHNHPSGDPDPSMEDLRVTRELVQAGRTLGVPVLDHLVIGDPGAGHDGWVSLRESGLVSFDAA